MFNFSNVCADVLVGTSPSRGLIVIDVEVTDSTGTACPTIGSPSTIPSATELIHVCEVTLVEGIISKT